MNKQEYLNLLSKHLKGIPAEEQRDILAEYYDHFDQGTANGKTEAQVAADLGDPRSIAREFRALYLVNEANANKSTRSLLQAAGAVIGLGFFNLIFVLGPFLGMLGVLIAFYAVGIALTVSGVVVFVATFAEPILPSLSIYITPALLVNPAITLFVSVGLTCLGLLVLIGDVYVTKGCYQLTLRYLKWNMRVVGIKEVH